MLANLLKWFHLCHLLMSPSHQHLTRNLSLSSSPRLHQISFIHFFKSTTSCAHWLAVMCFEWRSINSRVSVVKLENPDSTGQYGRAAKHCSFGEFWDVFHPKQFPCLGHKKAFPSQTKEIWDTTWQTDFSFEIPSSFHTGAALTVWKSYKVVLYLKWTFVESCSFKMFLYTGNDVSILWHLKKFCMTSDASRINHYYINERGEGAGVHVIFERKYFRGSL